jgi:hypothetical protein
MDSENAMLQKSSEVGELSTDDWRRLQQDTASSIKTAVRPEATERQDISNALKDPDPQFAS